MCLLSITQRDTDGTELVGDLRDIRLCGESDYTSVEEERVRAQASDGEGDKGRAAFDGAEFMLIGAGEVSRRATNRLAVLSACQLDSDSSAGRVTTKHTASRFI